MAKIKAIVRGPENYFDGVLHPPGDVVVVDEDMVSEEDFLEVETEVKLAQPVIDSEGKVRRTVTETVRKRVRFRPIGSAAIAEPATTPEIATGAIDRLNTGDFLKQSVSDIEDAIATGTYDDFLGAIEQAEKTGKARKGVLDAVKSRQAG